MKKYILCCAQFIIIITAVFAQNNPATYSGLENRLARGWNTWNYGTMLSQVLLPESLMIQINLRQTFIGTPGDPLFELQEAVPDKSNIIKPIAHSFDGSYTELLISGWKGNTIRVQTAAVNNEVFMLVTPVKRSADIHFNLELQAGMLWNAKGNVEKVNETIEARIAGRKYIIRSTGHPLTVFQPYMSPYLVFSGDSSIGFYSGEKTSGVKVEQIIEKAKGAYENRAAKYGDLSENFKAIETVLGWNTIYDPEHKRVITPVSRGWNKSWQGSVLFEWDTFFAALLFGLDNKDLAYSNAIAVTNGIPGKDFIGHYQMPGGRTSNGMSQPPVGSMVCWTLFEKYGDLWFLKEVYPKLFKWNRWWLTNRVNRDYLAWGGWPGAELQIAKWESGLDNSPMYEQARMEQVGKNAIMNLADVGLNSLYSADCMYLKKIALALGKNQDAGELEKRRLRFSEKTQSLWDSATGIYLNHYLDRDAFSFRLSPTLFYPMIAGIPDSARVSRMLRAHYDNPSEFYGKYIIPSIARNDSSYNNEYWKGAIWPPMNFLVYMGLRKYNKPAASDLALRSSRLFMDAWSGHFVLENINSDKGSSNYEDQVNADPFYHWGALMGLMEFMEKGFY